MAKPTASSDLTRTLERVRARERSNLLVVARQAAERVARRHSLGLVTVEDVVRELERAGGDARSLGSTVSAVFRVRGFERTAYRARLPRGDGRVRSVTVWRWSGARRPAVTEECPL